MDQIDYQKEQERKLGIWASALRTPEFNAVKELMISEVEKLRDKLEEEEDIEVRAELRVYRRILQESQYYANNISEQ